ncbi:hypothetical protein GCM10010358_42320 [Streptomyces minutiscleroticus]|uniref:Uncharacterized protein n=1 Tax=Streptomyces minutiscleroticus TaxID=68238 RepID=A0A918NP14_9ACTN|nr:hypothetical protein GCM10010358_42320 [Streptomyces minutiscleroticus]
MLPHALPDQPGAADLEEGGEDEQGGGTGDEHGGSLARRRAAADDGATGRHRHLMEGACRARHVGYIR